jgi:hypothetical protein
MLMVTDFWAWKHVAQARGLVWLRQDYGAGLIQGVVHTELDIDVAWGGLIIYHGVMLKVELRSDGRLHLELD